MSWEFKPSVDYGNPSPLTAPELISELRAAFLSKGFDRVEKVLMEREEKMKKSLREMSIEADVQKKQYQLMEKSNGDLAMKNVELENELRKYKRDCEEMEEKITRLSEEKKMFSDREKRAEERYNKLKKDLMEVEFDKRNRVFEMNQKIVALNHEKTRVEEERESWKRKYEELHVRYPNLEEETILILNRVPALKRKIKQELVSDEVMREEIFNGGQENPNPLEVAYGIVVASRQQLVDEESSSKMTGSSMGGVQGAKCQEVIEIDDSDDLKPIRCTSTSFPNVPASDFKSGETKMTPDFGKTEDSGQTGLDNGRTCIRSFLKTTNSKRKCVSSCIKSENASDVDDNTLIGRLKRRSLQELSHLPKTANDCVDAPNLGVSVTHTATAGSPTSFSPGVIISCSEKSKVKHYSQISSDKSASDVPQDDDGDNLIADNQRQTQHKVWAYLADMLRAFDEDDEVCMDAVCALYRQRIFKEKLPSFSSLVDAQRGTALAEFLIGTNPQGKRMRSSSELKQTGMKTLDECRKLANRFANLLFHIYQKKRDPFFPQ